MQEQGTRGTFVDFAQALPGVFYAVFVGVLVKIFATEVRLPYSSPFLEVRADVPPWMVPFFSWLWGNPLVVFWLFTAVLLLDWSSWVIGLQRIKRTFGGQYWRFVAAVGLQLVGLILLGISAATTLVGSSPERFHLNPYTLFGAYAFVSGIWSYVVITVTAPDPRDEFWKLFDGLVTRRTQQWKRSLERREESLRRQLQDLVDRPEGKGVNWDRALWTSRSGARLKKRMWLIEKLEKIAGVAVRGLALLLASLVLLWYVSGISLLFAPLGWRPFLLVSFLVLYLYANALSIFLILNSEDRNVLFSAGLPS